MTGTKLQTPKLSAADHARLMLNHADVANRFVRLGRKEYPVLHLGLGDMARFKAAFQYVEKVYEGFVRSKMTLADYLLFAREELLEMFNIGLPKATAAVLGISVAEAKTLGTPLELLNLVLAQWVHNLEIITLKQLFPHPDEDEDDEEENDNPLAVVERLMAAYNGMTPEIAYRQTIPQVYLMGQNSAVAYAKLEAKHGNAGEARGGNSTVSKKGKKGIYFEGKWWKSPKEMGAARYKRYLCGSQAAAYQGKSGSFQAVG